MSTTLLTGCTDCGNASMRWVHKGGRWQGRCKTDGCCACSWASTWEARKLDERAGVTDAQLDERAGASRG